MCEAALTSSCRPASPGAQATSVETGANPNVLSNSVNVLHGGGSKVYLNATFHNFPSFKQSFDEWCREGKHVVMINKCNKQGFVINNVFRLFLCTQGWSPDVHGVASDPWRSSGYRLV